jgi:DNA-directed RNA polymerase subunit RPC12/RpoP
MKVVYGHTDSIYVQMPFNRTGEVLSLLNAKVRDKFPNVMGLDEHPVVLEFEKYYESLGVGITKNRNAGLISWKDGKHLDEAEFVMTGFSAKRVAITKLAKTVQLEVLNRWVGQETEKQITDYLRTEYNRVLKGDVSLDEVTNRSRFKPERFQYKCSQCDKQYEAEDLIDMHTKFKSNIFCTKCGNPLELLTLGGKRPQISSGVEGVLWYNQLSSIPIIDSYIYMRVSDDLSRPTYTNPITGKKKRPKYVSSPSLEDMSQCLPDNKHYADSILKKAEPIYRAMGWDLTKVSIDENQTTLNEWW